MQPKDFVKFLKQYEFKLKVETLEKFEQEGWLQPIFRVNLTKQIQKSNLIFDADGIKRFYKHGFIEFPKNNDYKEWKEFKHDYKKKEMHDKKLMFYHPFQIFQIHNIMKNKMVSLIHYDSYDDKDLQKVLSNIKLNLDSRKNIFLNSPLTKIENLGFLMLLEESYKFHSFGTMDISWRAKNGFQYWANWKRKKFSAKKLLKQTGLSLKQIKNLYRIFASEGHNLDPLEKWYDLIRIMRPRTIQKLKGDALSAQFYYNTSMMIAQFIYDLTHEKMPEPDTIFDLSDGTWKEGKYSKPFDYSTRKTQRGIIKFFVRNTTTRIFVLVEGSTEKKIIEKICKQFGVNSDDGITIVDYEGISNLTSRKLKGIIQVSQRDHIPVFVIADNECNSKEKIKEIESKITNSEFKSHVWKKSFEEDNFGETKILKLINSYLNKEGKSLKQKEIAEFKKKGFPLVTSIAKAYSKKYHDDICNLIPSKTKISLILFSNRLKQITPYKKTKNPYPIENVMNDIFNMIPIWN